MGYKLWYCIWCVLVIFLSEMTPCQLLLGTHISFTHSYLSHQWCSKDSLPPLRVIRFCIILTFGPRSLPLRMKSFRKLKQYFFLETSSSFSIPSQMSLKSYSSNNNETPKEYVVFQLCSVLIFAFFLIRMNILFLICDFFVFSMCIGSSLFTISFKDKLGNGIVSL